MLEIKPGPEFVSTLPSSRGNAIDVCYVTKRYGAIIALNDVSFAIREGTCTAIVGPNGAGKTTLIDSMVGLKTIDEGEITVLGRRVTHTSRPDFRRVGAQLQDAALLGAARVREYLALTIALFDVRSDVGTVASRFGLDPYLTCRVSELSFGWRQRLGLALTLAHDPDLIFLDEPTTGLDPNARRKIWETIDDLKSRGRTIVLTSHYMDEVARLADNVVVVNAGRVIAQGSTAEIAAMGPGPSPTLDDAYVSLTNQEEGE